jgi:hypothetical protein
MIIWKILGSISIIDRAKIPKVISGNIDVKKCTQEEPRQALIFIEK